jgi:hypothetical protein
MVWDYPVYEPPKQDKEGRTVAKVARQALPADKALAFIAGDDPRPLLVLRECKVCNGTDDALLSRGNIDNEKTFLLSRWFHCVKLPVDVLEKDHPFYELFDHEDPEHMFMSARDGANKLPMESERSRAELWDNMMEVLAANYEEEPASQVKQMAKLIDRFDVVDTEIFDLEADVDQVLEKKGPGDKKLKKLNRKLEDAREERQDLFKAIDQATAELKLKRIAAAGGARSEKDS